MVDSNERFFTMAETYDQMCQTLVPKYDFLQEEMLDIATLSTPAPIVIDLGGGSGILLEKVLTRYPQAQCTWIDYSEDFLAVAKQRLTRFDGKVDYIVSPLEAAWEPRIAGKADLVLSMSAIHHLTSEEKQQLYQRVYDVLKPGGWFFNIDEMKTVYHDAYVSNMHRWVNYVTQAREGVPAEKLPYYEKWKGHFDNWKIRNVDNVDGPKVKGDDIHQGFMTQLTWLKESGFVNVDVYIKYQLWCVIGGQK